jgi:hypothetical protein
LLAFQRVQWVSRDGRADRVYGYLLSCKICIERDSEPEENSSGRIGTITDLVDRRLRDVYLSQLIFAARNLALECVIGGISLRTCTKCYGSASGDMPLEHLSECGVGRVLRLVDALKEIPPTSQPERRPCEEVSSEQANAAAEMQPRAISKFIEPWRWCEADGFRGIEDGNGIAIIDASDLGVDEPEERAYCDRIIACVNFCAGRFVRVDVPSAHVGGAR